MIFEIRERIPLLEIIKLCGSAHVTIGEYMGTNDCSIKNGWDSTYCEDCEYGDWENDCEYRIMKTTVWPKFKGSAADVPLQLIDAEVVSIRATTTPPLRGRKTPDPSLEIVIEERDSKNKEVYT